MSVVGKDTKEVQLCSAQGEDRPVTAHGILYDSKYSNADSEATEYWQELLKERPRLRNDKKVDAEQIHATEAKYEDPGICKRCSDWNPIVDGAEALIALAFDLNCTNRVVQAADYILDDQEPERRG